MSAAYEVVEGSTTVLPTDVDTTACLAGSLRAAAAWASIRSKDEGLTLIERRRMQVLRDTLRAEARGLPRKEG